MVRSRSSTAATFTHIPARGNWPVASGRRRSEHVVTISWVDRTRRFVVVSGLPGSGKSTLARQIAPPLRLQLIDTDDFLEMLLDRYTTVDSALRFRLSRQADDDMRTAAEASSGAVLVSFWRREELSATAGTPTGWLRSLPNVVEVHCACSPAIAEQRFLARRRHPGHGDATRDRDDVAAQLEAIAALGPLALGSVVRVDTEDVVDVEALIAELSYL